MSDISGLAEARARQEIRERLARASAPHLPHVPRRHRLAEQLRRFADRLDS